MFLWKPTFLNLFGVSALRNDCFKNGHYRKIKYCYVLPLASAFSCRGFRLLEVVGASTDTGSGRRVRPERTIPAILVARLKRTSKSWKQIPGSVLVVLRVLKTVDTNTLQECCSLRLMVCIIIIIAERHCASDGSVFLHSAWFAVQDIYFQGK